MDRLKVKVIAGAANNQLATDAIGTELEKRKILYAPDYVINAGGLINVSVELEGYSRERALRLTRGIYYNTLKILRLAKAEGLPSNQAADRQAEVRNPVHRPGAQRLLVLPPRAQRRGQAVQPLGCGPPAGPSCSGPRR